MYESELIIAVRNGNGEIIASQTFEEFMNGRKNIEILNYSQGKSYLIFYLTIWVLLDMKITFLH